MIQDTIIPFSFMLGVIHTLEPGHGKTAMVAYMASGKKNIGHALAIAIGSAFSHTFSLFLIAFITHLAGHALADGHLNSETVTHTLEWIGALSIVAIGAYLTIHSLRKNKSGHHHQCHHNHSKAYSELESTDKKHQGYKIAALLGLGGGLIPCPTALAAYFSGVASGHTEKVFIMLSAFSIGVILSFLIIAFVIRFLGSKVSQSSKFKHIEKALIFLKSKVILIIGLVYVVKLLLH